MNSNKFFNPQNMRRFRLFFTGVILGSIVMYFMVFKDKNYFSTPEQVIKEQLLKRKLIFTKHGQCRMECRGISEAEVKEVMKSGSVNYKKSEVHATPCKKYAVEGKTADGQNVRIVYGLCDTLTTVITAIDLGLEKDTCACGTE
jgi:hypothetical protein